MIERLKDEVAENSRNVAEALGREAIAAAEEEGEDEEEEEEEEEDGDEGEEDEDADADGESDDDYSLTSQEMKDTSEGDKMLKAAYASRDEEEKRSFVE
jgi:hypothetical protein